MSLCRSKMSLLRLWQDRKDAMAALALLAKDFREHWVSLLFLSLGCITVFLLLLIQNKGAVYSMSSLEIVRYALLYLMPVVSLIVGNRLIVNEYLSGTRLFVEALPLGQSLPLILKYLTGLGYLSVIAVLLILLAVNSAS
ncbi:MAG: ABC-type transport system involved in multi-copper enzyme maturation permease subunit, partial [Granulosicoccus sp.]